MSIVDALTLPFVDYDFMRRALAAGIILAMGSTPLGVFIMLRRMTLVGDALAHAILPGVAAAFLVAGLSVWAMTLGGILAAIIVALLASFLVRFTKMREDAAFALLYLFSLSAGVAMVSAKGSSVNLFHMLFGNILAIDHDALILVTGISSFSVIALAMLYRRLVIDGFDRDFLRVAGLARLGGGFTNGAFFVLLMINLVAAFQAMGTLMALGLMILPALAARFWARSLDMMLLGSFMIAVMSVYTGLLASYYMQIPSGPAITMVAGGIAFISACIGRVGSVRGYTRG